MNDGWYCMHGCLGNTLSAVIDPQVFRRNFIYYTTTLYLPTHKPTRPHAIIQAFSVQIKGTGRCLAILIFFNECR